MLLDRFLCWLASRAALRELQYLAHQEVDSIKSPLSKLLSRAMDALKAGDRQVAADCWEHARTCFPDYVLQSDNSARILLGLNRDEELEALMLRAHKRWPHDFRFLSRLGQIAERRKDYEAAELWWKRVRSRVPFEANGYIRGAACLQELGRLNEAVKVLRRGSQFATRGRPQATLLLWEEFGGLLELTKDWKGALKCWDHIAVELEASVGYHRAALACEAIGDLGGCLRRLHEGRSRFPADQNLLIELAKYMERRARLEDAAQYWIELRMAFPAAQTGYREAARCLTLQNSNEAADNLLLEAEIKFPEEIWPLRQYAERAHASGEWDKAEQRWRSFRDRWPRERDGYLFGAFALQQLGQYNASDELRNASKKLT